MANEHRDKQDRDMNRDPISGAPGAHPVGTGVGAAGGGVARVDRGDVDEVVDRLDAHREPHQVGRQPGQQPRPGDAAQRAGDCQLHEQPAVHVPKRQVRGPRGAGGEDFSGMHRRAHRCRRQSHAQQDRRGDDAEGHPQRAVHQLGEQPHQHEPPEDLGQFHLAPPVRMGG